MTQSITNGIKITVETEFQPIHSQVLINEYIFAYHITIENTSMHAIRLMNRHWRIFDSNGDYRDVNGEGVVGVQPVIEAGESYDYISSCNLRTEIGKMSGHYIMNRVSDG